MTISFWSLPNDYVQAQINLDRLKPFWTIQNCFGHIEGQGIREKLYQHFWAKFENSGNSKSRGTI